MNTMKVGSRLYTSFIYWDYVYRGEDYCFTSLLPFSILYRLNGFHIEAPSIPNAGSWALGPPYGVGLVFLF